MMPPSLRVQTVLYNTDPDAISRFCSGIDAACSLARKQSAISRAVLVVGDSSPLPLPDDAPLLVTADSEGPFESIDYLHFGQNLGSAGGHNRLFETSHEDVILVVNPDTYASPRLVVELLEGLTDPSVGVVEARQLPLEHPKAFDPDTGDTSWASGCCFLVRASVVEKTGGFDTDLFFLHGDDVDFSWRVRLNGWRVIHRPSARVFHDKRLSDEGYVVAGDSEIRYSAMSSVILPWRYSRRDLALQQLASMDASPDVRIREVASELRHRIEAGLMPDSLDNDHRVAQFVAGEYAINRFSYGDP